MNGILVVNKPKGMTSRDVVNYVSKCLHTKKIGHTGTLDPLATGVLVLAIGSMTKMIELLTSEEKEYVATFQVGLETDTLDITGKMLAEKECDGTDLSSLPQILSSFVGTYEQEVPLYSAVKVDGKRLYQYAREGNLEVPLPKRRVEIKSISLLEEKFPYYSFSCLVSKGTYIRSLIRDIGKKLDLPCTMTELKRTKQGIFTLSDSFTLEEIANGNFHLFAVEEAFVHFEKIVVDEEIAFQVKNGVKLPFQFSSEKVLLFDSKQQLLAIYEKDPKAPHLARAYRVFPSNE